MLAFLWPVRAQETDLTQTPNPARAGIAKSFAEQIGPGQGDAFTPGSSLFLIQRDPFRSIARGRQLFQRKFTLAQGLGPRTLDGVGSIANDASIGAGLADSCASCHGRPRGAAGFGGDVFTRPDSRDAPHLFGLGLVEMLADEITQDLRAIRTAAVNLARAQNKRLSLPLRSKGIEYGWISAGPDGSVDTSRVEGVDADLRVRPFFAQGGTISIREFLVGALNAEMGLEAVDPLLLAASRGADVVTPSGMRLTGSQDRIEAPVAHGETDDPDRDGVVNEYPASVVDHMEFYLLNYFKPGTYRQGWVENLGRQAMERMGCTKCHVPDLVIERDRRVADVETRHDPQQQGINGLFATATPLFVEVPDGSGYAPRKVPAGGRFVVRNVFADFKRHDLGPAFHERNFDGTVQREFMTEPLWGVGSTAPYGHDGRSINLREVILRHGGEAERSRRIFERSSAFEQEAVLAFLNSLVIFGPPDTASNLDPAVPSTPGFPLFGHGSIKLSVLFNVPGDPE
ncbi:MAG: thiol oxidoreductase-like protein [Planctomycetes bacterium]|nr:thiol oxidoreductase-like protein [Planctomycetota bacterium]